MFKRFGRGFGFRALSLITAAILLAAIPLPTQANGTPPASIALYISAPFVQGSHLSGPGVSTESFNGFTAGACPPTTAVGALAGSGCVVTSGATSPEPTGEPLIGGSLTRYAGSSGSMNSTFTFPGAVKYVGLWWMMGSAGNTVQFLNSSNTVVAELSSADIVQFFGVSYGTLTNSDTGTVNRIDGATHPRKHYFRSPANYTGTTTSPVMDYDTDNYANEPWVYLNLFVAGDANVSKLRLAGNNFEYDNITVSTVDAAPRGDMVFLRDVLGTPPTPQTLEWAPTNTTADFTNGDLTPDQPAVVTSPVSGGGAISYSVVNAGMSGCTVDSSTGVITATGIGACQVRATAAATATRFSATKDVTFTFTANPPGTPSAPTAVAGDGKATITVTPPATGGAPASYLVTAEPGGETCTVTVPDTSCEISSLTNGVSYTFTTTATNAIGTSAASPASDPVTPTAAPVVEDLPESVTPYAGPIPLTLSGGCLPELSSKSVTMTGKRLHSILSASVGGKAVAISEQSRESVKLEIPALTAGTYDLNLSSAQGPLIHQNAIKVCSVVIDVVSPPTPAPTTSAPVTPPTVIPVTPTTPAPTSSAPVAETKTFFVSERFTAFTGDLSPVSDANRSAIESFILANPGLTLVTCVGSTSGPEIPVSDQALATSRAENACQIVKELLPSVEIRIKTDVGRGTGKFFRAVTLFGVGVAP